MLQESSGDHALLQRNLRINHKKNALKRCVMPAETLCTTSGEASAAVAVHPQVFSDERGFLYELE